MLENLERNVDPETEKYLAYQIRAFKAKINQILLEFDTIACLRLF